MLNLHQEKVLTCPLLLLPIYRTYAYILTLCIAPQSYEAGRETCMYAVTWRSTEICLMCHVCERERWRQCLKVRSGGPSCILFHVTCANANSCRRSFSSECTRQCATYAYGYGRSSVHWITLAPSPFLIHSCLKTNLDLDKKKDSRYKNISLYSLLDLFLFSKLRGLLKMLAFLLFFFCRQTYRLETESSALQKHIQIQLLMLEIPCCRANRYIETVLLSQSDWCV